MSKHPEEIITVLRRGIAAIEMPLRQKSEWIVIIPSTLASPELEAMLWFRDSDNRPVSRTTLGDGSILLSGH